MKIEVFPSASGDCVLLTSQDDRRILADAGLPAAYDASIAAPLSALRQTAQEIDVAYVSHIDRDHIGGILKMLDAEMKWRVYDHMRSKGRPFKKPAAPRPPVIRQIWHNAFLEDIARTEAVQLGAALAVSANALAGLDAARLGGVEAAQKAAEVRMLALSVGDAIEVNWRIGAEQLDIPLNPDFGGKMMVSRPKKPIRLGTLSVTVLGPTGKQLKELREEWVEWLGKSQAQLDKLRRQHNKDVEDLRSGLSPLDVAKLSKQLVSDVEKDVTPPNLASLVLLVEENGTRVLLTGDAGDESLLEYFRSAALLAPDGSMEVDVLKVPHHGAHNSFSPEFVASVRAAHYIFCGDGEHHNPEPDVVEGYLAAVRKKPLKDGGDTTFWFNCSSGRAAAEHVGLWKKIEAMFKPGKAPPGVRLKVLGTGADRLVLQFP